MSNFSKYPGHLPDFACYDGNLRNQGLVGVNGACLNMTLHMAPEEKVCAGEMQRLTFHSDCVVSRRRKGRHTNYCPLLNVQASKKEQRGLIRFLEAEGVEGRAMHRRVKAM
ncbi:hypothetical protein TNCV_693221 [Trichonephila clavipes]|nr:hypothetical protein TNCV_693221 [Trichonephila clavipes]